MRKVRTVGRGRNWGRSIGALLRFAIALAGLSGMQSVKAQPPSIHIGTRLVPCEWNGKYNFTDPRDGRSYRQIQIGDQCWMAQNLYFGKVVPDMGQTNNRTAECTCQGNDPKNCEAYGGLYAWDEVMNYTQPKEGATIQGLCPDGWHLPSDAEWCEMEAFLDPNMAVRSEAWRYTNIAWRLMGDLENWNPKVFSLNHSGFDALPAGSAVSGWFFYLGRGAYFWTSSPYSAAAAWSRGIHSQTGEVFRGPGDKLTGYSVRCIKDL